MTLSLRDELEAAATVTTPHSDLVARSRQAGQRRLVRRQWALVGTGTAIAAVALGASFTPHWWTQSESSVVVASTSPSVSPTSAPSVTADPVVAITGTAADWLVAVAASMPNADRMTPVSATTNGPAELSKSSSVMAIFRYTSAGHTTSLVVTAVAKDTQADLDTVLAGCDQGGVTCEPVQQTSTGPVLIRHTSSRGVIDALSFRASGVAVMARIPDGPRAAGSPRPSDGLQGLAISLDDLVNIAALSPEPKLEDPTANSAGTATSTP